MKCNYHAFGTFLTSHVSSPPYRKDVYTNAEYIQEGLQIEQASVLYNICKCSLSWCVCMCVCMCVCVSVSVCVRVSMHICVCV